MNEMRMRIRRPSKLYDKIIKIHEKRHADELIKKNKKKNKKRLDVNRTTRTMFFHFAIFAHSVCASLINCIKLFYCMIV